MPQAIVRRPRMDYTANMRRPRVDYTPVMFQNAWQSVRNAARSASKNSATNPATKKAKNFVKDVAEGVAEKHGKQAGKDLLKQLQQTTPERQHRDVQIPDMSPLSKSPIRTPRKSAREQRKRQLMDWERWRQHQEQKKTRGNAAKTQTTANVSWRRVVYD